MENSIEENLMEIPVEFSELFEDGWREAAVYGGRNSLKSHTVARYLLIRARQQKTRVGCFREFQNSITESSHQLLADLISKYKLTEFEVTNNAIVNRLNGSDFIFKGLWHNEQSIKSIEGIDVAWVEEAQTISNSSIEVLTPTVRNKGSKIIYTYNRLLDDDPVHNRLVIEGRPNTLIINVNYDIAIKNGMMADVLISEMEDDKAKRPSLYRHKWLGEPSSTERKIYKSWNIIDEVPMEARLERFGVDFGYTNDPTAIVAVYYYNGSYIIDEVMYQTGMLNGHIADTILNQEGKALVIADAAEPKSIDEIRLKGLTILPAKKGAGSINQGIQYVQAQIISVTRRSANVLREYKGYLWMLDREGKIINEPEESNNHAMDAIRYALSSLKDPNRMGAHTHYPQSSQPRTGLNNSTVRMQGLPPELQEKPKTAFTFRPRL
jgi:phage terminase large subunit